MNSVISEKNLIDEFLTAKMESYFYKKIPDEPREVVLQKVVERCLSICVYASIITLLAAFHLLGRLMKFGTIGSYKLNNTTHLCRNCPAVSSFTTALMITKILSVPKTCKTKKK